MKKLLSMSFLLTSFLLTAQVGTVSPTSGTQSTLTGSGAANTTSVNMALPPSMLDMDRFRGSYTNGSVSANGDMIGISYTAFVPEELEFRGVIKLASPQKIMIDGVNTITGMNMQIEVTVAPDNKKNPKELYVIHEPGNLVDWILTEDPFSPKK
jgi:hypothetical protein